MRDLFVPYDLAVKLQNKGFKAPCLAWYDTLDGTPKFRMIVQDGYHEAINAYSIEVAAPLWQQVIDWLRDEHRLILVPHHRMNGKCRNYWYSISRFEQGPAGVKVGVVGMINIGCHLYNTDALQSAIEKALELLTTNP